MQNTEPIWDAERVLGMELRRMHDKHIITIIIDVCKKTWIIFDENIPMQSLHYPQT